MKIDKETFISILKLGMSMGPAQQELVEEKVNNNECYNHIDCEVQAMQEMVDKFFESQDMQSFLKDELEIEII